MNYINRKIRKIIFRLLSKELANQAYLAILGREGDSEGLANHASVIRKQRSIQSSLSDLLDSEERMQLEKEQHISCLSEELARQAYLSILNREADPEGLAHHASVIRSQQSIQSTLCNLLDSRERMQLEKEKHDLCAKSSDIRIIFLHTEKTGGTSLREMLLDAYGEDSCYASYQDNLDNFSKRWLSKFSLIYGHYHYDRIQRLLGSNYQLVTFLRDPFKRIISLYNFWRSHDECHPNYHGIIKYVNESNFDEFFHSKSAKISPQTWNHMTYVIMGFNQWNNWRNALFTIHESSKKDYIKNEIEPLLIHRLKEFFYIGFQDDYENCVNSLFEKIKLPMPPKISRLHSVEILQQRGKSFKRGIFLLKPSLEVMSTLNDFTIIDRVLYENALKIHGHSACEQLV